MNIMNTVDEGLEELFQALRDSHGLLETALFNGNKLFEASTARLEAAHR